MRRPASIAATASELSWTGAPPRATATTSAGVTGPTPTVTMVWVCMGALKGSAAWDVGRQAQPVVLRKIHPARAFPRSLSTGKEIRRDVPAFCTLFVNAEPEVLSRGATQLAALAADGHLPVVVEITERALTARPAELLDAVDRLRAAGFGIALDDVGADERSLALLPLLRPDIVKWDISLVHAHPSRRSGGVMNGVCAYAEATGAGVVAEALRTSDTCPRPSRSARRSLRGGTSAVPVRCRPILMSQGRQPRRACHRVWCPNRQSPLSTAGAVSASGERTCCSARHARVEANAMELGALVARDLGDAGPDRDRRFEALTSTGNSWSR